MYRLKLERFVIAFIAKWFCFLNEITKINTRPLPLTDGFIQLVMGVMLGEADSFRLTSYTLFPATIRMWGTVGKFVFK